MCAYIGCLFRFGLGGLPVAVIAFRGWLVELGGACDRVLHIGQCEAEWGGWGALGSGRGDAPHQSPCLPSCEGLHGAWCLKLFPEFLLEGGAVHFRIFS